MRKMFQSKQNFSCSFEVFMLEQLDFIVYADRCITIFINSENGFDPFVPGFY